MAETILLRRSDVRERYPEGTWQQILFSEFSTSLESSSRPYPCMFGVRGYRADQLRYSFQETLDLDLLAIVLREFVYKSRSFGPNTSLVVFIKPEKLEQISVYEENFWHVLKGLSKRDETAWPDHIPTIISSSEWEFCFAGEPVFVVCNTPAHLLRQSRRSSSLMLTFQPRWVFDNILRTEKSTKRAFNSVRKRLANYDFVPISPALGKYGEPNILEYQQYFLGDENVIKNCPFHTLK